MLRSFREDPYYFFKYHSLNVALYGAGSLFLLQHWTSFDLQPNGWILLTCILLLVIPSFTVVALATIGMVPLSIGIGLITPEAWHLLLIPLGLSIGFVSCFSMHNASHQSMGPRGLNRIIGEWCGLHQIMGFPGWAIAHIIHHQYPDDPKKDPHPPESLSFPAFTKQMGACMAKVMNKNYLDLWGDKPKFKRIWTASLLLSTLNRYLRGLFLLLLFGPTLFVLLLMPSKFWCILIYSHFNYYTHRPDANGEMEILNLDHNFLFKFLNAVSAGSYYHKNHHQKPSLLDPRKLKRVRLKIPNHQTMPVNAPIEESVSPAGLEKVNH